MILASEYPPWFFLLIILLYVAPFVPFTIFLIMLLVKRKKKEKIHIEFYFYLAGLFFFGCYAVYQLLNE